MSTESPLIQSMRTAVAAAPTDVPLRLHLAELLLGEGLSEAAVAEAAVALQHAPGDMGARTLMMRAMGLPAPAAEQPGPEPIPEKPRAQEPAPEVPAAPAPPTGFDWAAAENEVADAVPPRFVTPGPTSTAPEAPLAADGGGDPGDATAWEVDTPGTVTLADVGGMEEIKERLEAAFLAPMRNPELGRLYGKSLRGGLLMYGPPGCGKTFIARAVAGELGASFMSVSINDVLDMWMGNSERNMHEVFETARRQAPCVLFLDEVDALGAKRSRMQHGGMRNTVNQLLTELDGVGGANEGVFVLAATNVPWDVDIALRRPGRLDRTLLVLPPDAPAREAILRYHLRDRPIESVDLGKLVKVTEDLSGADLAHLCESASERALLDSTRTGVVRMINMKDLLGAAKEIRPSTDPWFASARNVAMFANEGGMYDELLAYLKRKRKL
ncbi:MULTISPECIES: ATP-binding protein [unclassified Streptomyces]|jgi:AAA+ superfamily predicted ATPase|uniref:ATP-binding protein n=1 Tax=unclassified Streptomyces TaxID=2593676 RepID=UPI0008ED7D5D|nr:MULTISPECIES: ATP-binding protein [unclassified Streptomyces]MDX3769560.1 ATP-binding protein [Streptomyces sp. AK08-01B]MDX3819791.1 ATP-binding protein [Streptomyces sp. AK08-01A]SFT30620.1 ATPase family associated with various cellular activities (AAA) [Streptomyces sp. ok210]